MIAISQINNPVRKAPAFFTGLFFCVTLSISLDPVEGAFDDIFAQFVRVHFGSFGSTLQ